MIQGEKIKPLPWSDTALHPVFRIQRVSFSLIITSLLSKKVYCQTRLTFYNAKIMPNMSALLYYINIAK